MTRATGGTEPTTCLASSPDDASPSRARLGRVAEMLREAEEAAPPARSARERWEQPGDVVVSMVPRRVRPRLPRPRAAADDRTPVTRAR